MEEKQLLHPRFCLFRGLRGGLAPLASRLTAPWALASQDASTTLRVLDVPGGAALVGGEGGQDFGLLTLRDLEEI